MRISCDPNDPGYSKAFLESNLVVICKIDGKRLHRVITADDSRGYVKKYVTHEKTGNILTHSKNNQPITEVLYGKVELKLVSKREAEQIG